MVGRVWLVWWGLVVGLVGSGCMGLKGGGPKILGSGLGRGSGFVEMDGREFSRVTGVELVPERDWLEVRLGLWGVEVASVAEVAASLGGRVVGERVVLSRRLDGCYLVEVGYGRGSVRGGSGADWAFDLVGLVARGIVDNGDEFRWSRETKERLEVRSVVGLTGTGVTSGFEVVESGLVISGALYGDVGWAFVKGRMSRSSSAGGGLRTDGVEFPIRCTVLTGEWVPVFSYGEVSVGGLPLFGGAGVDVLAIRVTWLGTGTPTWLR